jgi:hypothetical protein
MTNKISLTQKNIIKYALVNCGRHAPNSQVEITVYSAMEEDQHPPRGFIESINSYGDPKKSNLTLLHEEKRQSKRGKVKLANIVYIKDAS